MAQVEGDPCVELLKRYLRRLSCVTSLADIGWLSTYRLGLK